MMSETNTELLCKEMMIIDYDVQTHIRTFHCKDP